MPANPRLPESRIEGSAMRTVSHVDPLDPWGPPAEEQPDLPDDLRQHWHDDLERMGEKRPERRA